MHASSRRNNHPFDNRNLIDWRSSNGQPGNSGCTGGADNPFRFVSCATVRNKFYWPFIWSPDDGVVYNARCARNGTINKTPGNSCSYKPAYAFRFLSTFPQGYLILGAVFLCVTGAEALYSDLGHCGIKNIRISWIFVKTMLILNYFGQGAWYILAHPDDININPFYAIMPQWFWYQVLSLPPLLPLCQPGSY